MSEPRYGTPTTGFGFKLKEQREKRKISQQELADLSGVPISTIQSLEINRRRPLVITATKLAKALGVTTPELYK